VRKLSGVKSPSVFVELSTEHARKQFEMLIEQTKQLAALAQKVMLATVEPLKTASQKRKSPEAVPVLNTIRRQTCFPLWVTRNGTRYLYLRMGQQLKQ
jgi:Phasin protein